MTLPHDVAGAGPSIVLLHAGVCDRRMWDPQWATLVGAGYRLVRCDFRGFGDAPVPPRPYNDAEDVFGLLDDLDIEQAAFIGSSYGGRIALEFAARWPQRTTALALLCSAAPQHSPSAVLQEFDTREDALLEAGDIESAVELNVATWLSPTADAKIQAAVRHMQHQAFELQLAAADAPGRTRTEFDLSSIGAPTLAVSGELDLPDFRQFAARLPTLLTNARHLELPGAAHLPNLERPAETTAALVSFFKRTLECSRQPSSS
ncbi:alpha/beta fold hydrolase [Nocardia sp. NPDC057030]|uniref:alpha/beta fold hydrolase n=1 Tax=unclassified Nocardia TaxID=2637762 RepID=UPI00363B87F9